MNFSRCKIYSWISRYFAQKYTVGHKKRATLFGIITPMFRGGFLHFLHQWKQEEILYRGITNLATLPQLCLYTTWENLKTHTTAHFETNCQCILMLNAINGKNESNWTVNCLQFFLGNSLNSLLAENLLHSHRFLIKFYLRNSTLGLLLY